MKRLLLLAFILIGSFATFGQKRIVQPRTVEEKLNEEYCSGMFKTIEGTYFDLLNDNAAISVSGYLNILDWLQGRVAGLQIYTNRLNDRVPYIRNSRAGIFVDEMSVTPGFLNSLAVTDIAMIKIIKGPFAGGFGSAGGAIAIYTKHGEDEGEEE
jgi:hypothetical protein